MYFILFQKRFKVNSHILEVWLVISKLITEHAISSPKLKLNQLEIKKLIQKICKVYRSIKWGNGNTCS